MSRAPLLARAFSAPLAMRHAPEGAVGQHRCAHTHAEVRARTIRSTSPRLPIPFLPLCSCHVEPVGWSGSPTPVDSAPEPPHPRPGFVNRIRRSGLTRTGEVTQGVTVAEVTGGSSSPLVPFVRNPGSDARHIGDRSPALPPAPSQQVSGPRPPTTRPDSLGRVTRRGEVIPRSAQRDPTLLTARERSL